MVPESVTGLAPCTGVILAGGHASRFGGMAKGLERVGGERIIDRVARVLRDATDDLLLIANTPGSQDWLPGVRVERDVQTGLGGLGGIHAALSHAGRSVLVAAWDMPFLSGALMRELRRAGEAADGAVPESDSRRGLEPLCAYYGIACLGPIERRLAAGDRRVVAFFDDIRMIRIPALEVAQFGDPSVLFMNVNTPEELTAAERYVSSPDGRHHRQEEQR